MTRREPDGPAMDPNEPAPATEASSGPKWIRALIALAVLLGVVTVAKLLPVDEWLNEVKEHVRELGALGPVVYGVLYVVAALAFVPGSAITVGSGAIFGVALGTLVVSLASTAAVAISFPLARTLLRSRIEGLAMRKPAFRAIDDAIAEGGWKIVGLLRLSPVVPFTALNYFLGLTRTDYIPAVLVSSSGRTNVQPCNIENLAYTGSCRENNDILFRNKFDGRHAFLLLADYQCLSRGLCLFGVQHR